MILRWSLFIITLCTVGGCGVHLHNQKDHAAATAAKATFEEIDFETVIADARANAEALTEVERDNRRRLAAVGRTIELQSIIADRSAFTPGTATSAAGWEKLRRDAEAALGPVTDERTLEIIQHARELRDEARYEELELIEQGVAFQNDYPEVTLPVDFARIPTDDAALTRLVADVPDDVARDYELTVYDIAQNVRQLRRQLEQADLAIAQILAHEEDREILSEVQPAIDTLEQRISSRHDLLKRLGAEFEAARAEFQKAEKAFAMAATPSTDAPETTDTPPGDVENNVEVYAKQLIDVIKEAQDAASATESEPALRQMASAVIVELIARVDAAVAADDSPEGVAARALVAEIKKQRLGRLVLGETVNTIEDLSINRMLLELAAHRQGYEFAKAADDFDRRLLEIKRAQKQAMTDSISSWSRVRARVLSLDQQGVAPTDVAAAMADRTTTVGQREEIVTALIAYAQANIYRGRYQELQVNERELYRERHVRRSEIALLTWRDFIGAPVTEIVAYHEGGITSEEIAGLLNTAGLAAIAVGVN